MKKRGELVLLVLLTAISIVGAAGTKETAAAVQSGAIGSAGNPVKVTYLCKDVDPITYAQQFVMLEKAIEEGMAKEGKYVDLVILSLRPVVMQRWFPLLSGQDRSIPI